MSWVLFRKKFAEVGFFVYFCRLIFDNYIYINIIVFNLLWKKTMLLRSN